MCGFRDPDIAPNKCCLISPRLMYSTQNTPTSKAACADPEISPGKVSWDPMDSFYSDYKSPHHTRDIWVSSASSVAHTAHLPLASQTPFHPKTQ